MVILSLAGLAFLSFVARVKTRSFASFAGAALLWGCLSGAGRLADQLAQTGSPAERISLGPQLLILLAVALLARCSTRFSAEAFPLPRGSALAPPL